MCWETQQKLDVGMIIFIVPEYEILKLKEKYNAMSAKQ